MEKPNHPSDIFFSEDNYTIEWIDIENAELDAERYLNDIENFFRRDFENNMPEEKVYWLSFLLCSCRDLITIPILL